MEARVEQLVAELYEEFVGRDFTGAIDTVWNIGVACKLRMPLTVLEMGVDHNRAVWSEPTFQMNLIQMISHLRLGEVREAESVYFPVLMSGPPGRQHLLTCLGLAIDRTEGNVSLESGRSNNESLQMHYYAAEGALTARDWPKAKDLLKRCLAFEALCPERRFAKARLQWLDNTSLL